MDIENIEKDIYSSFASIASAIGYSEIHGRTIAALMVSGNRLSLQELSKKAGYSVSTLSLSLDLLEFLGMIRKVKNAGDRNLYIELQGNLLEGLKKAFIIKLQKSISDSLGSYDGYKKMLKDSKDENAKQVMKALIKLENEIKKLDHYVNLLSKLKL